MREILSRHECDLVHIPSLFWMPQVRLCCPYVVTVHDVLDFMYRAKNGANWQRTLHYYSTQQVLRHAGRILAVSNFTKMDIARLFNIRPEKIEVIYNAIDDRFLQGHTSERERQFIAERFQVNYPFLLYAGRIGPQKNLVRIIEAFSALKTELAKEGKYPDLKLIIIGDEVSRHLDVRRTVVKSGVQNDVRFLGFVSIDVLRIFYDTAKIFVFPSLYEGFGLAATGSDVARNAGGDVEYVFSARSSRKSGGHGESRERVRDHARAASRAHRSRPARQTEGQRLRAGEALLLAELRSPTAGCLLRGRQREDCRCRWLVPAT